MKKITLSLIAIVLYACIFSGCACQHTWTAATCTTPKVCSSCGETSGEALGHKWQEATCTTPTICSICAETAGNALGHSWKNATCTEPDTCFTCGTTRGDACGHLVTEWNTTYEPTCTTEGTKTGICNECGVTTEQAISVIDHNAGDWTITVEPTEDTDGTKVRSCTVCGEELASEKFSLSAAEIAQRYKSKCQNISYTNLARSPGEYKGTAVKFTGKVVQVCSEATSALYYSTYRIATSGSYDNIVYIYVDNYGSDTRILEDDWITIYGDYDGLYTYKTVLGASKTIPSIKVKYID